MKVEIEKKKILKKKTDKKTLIREKKNKEGISAILRAREEKSITF